jgi:hypothetical protein
LNHITLLLLPLLYMPSLRSPIFKSPIWPKLYTRVTLSLKTTIPCARYGVYSSSWNIHISSHLLGWQISFKLN